MQSFNGNSLQHPSDSFGGNEDIELCSAQFRISSLAQTARRLPPYAKAVSDYVFLGRAPNVFVFTGPNAWEFARQRLRSHGAGSVIVLPAGDDPATYRWPRIPNGALIDARSMKRSEALAIGRAVVSGGTPMVLVLTRRPPALSSAGVWSPGLL